MDDKNNVTYSHREAAFTVVSPNYLAYAWSVKRSFLTHNPDKFFFICVIGDSSVYPGSVTENIYFSSDIKDGRIGGMTKRYNPFELSCALKPYFADYIFSMHADVQRLIYLDGDMLVFGKFKLLSTAAITLSPHRIHRIGYLPEEDNYDIVSLNRYGVYNAGYFELQRKKEAFDFLEWWKILMEKWAHSKPDEHLFTDQLWLNLVHSYFDDIYINKNPGYNMAFWNLIERSIEVRDGQYWINGEPLVLFHFSKYKQEKPEEMVDYNHPYLTFQKHPQIKPIFDMYWESVQKEGNEKIRKLPYPFLYQTIVPKRSFWKRLFG